MTNLGAYKSQLVVTIVPLYILYVTSVIACYRIQFLTDLFKDPFLSSVISCGGSDKVP